MGRTTKCKPLQHTSKDKGSDQKTQVTQSPSEQTAASVKSGSSTKRREPKPDHSPIPGNISGDFWQTKETLETKLAATLEGEEEMEEKAETSSMDGDGKSATDNGPGSKVIEVETASEYNSKRSATLSSNLHKSAQSKHAPTLMTQIITFLAPFVDKYRFTPLPDRPETDMEEWLLWCTRNFDFMQGFTRGLQCF